MMPQTNALLEEGRVVRVIIKESDVALGRKGSEQHSISNCLPAQVTNIEYGTLVSRIYLDYADIPVRALIPTHSVHHLDLEEGEEVQLWIRMN